MGMENNAGPAPAWLGGGEMHVRELHKQTNCSLSNGSDGGSFLGDLCPVFPQTGPEVTLLSSDSIPPIRGFPCAP